MQSQFHPGELAVQLRAGEEEIAAQNSKLVTNTILGGAKPFLEKQFMVVLATMDNEGAAWSSVIYGKPGFIKPDGDTSLEINVHERDLEDPFWNNVYQNPQIGMLFIELGSRRRYRVNGNLDSIDEVGLKISVNEAYPNCPRYIQKRHLRSMDDQISTQEKLTGHAIDNIISPLITQADTLFIATSNPGSGADASHRGGSPGFVQLVDENTFRIPDFNGNSMFNTLGNIETNPKTGICIPDFNGQTLLQLTGQAKTLWDQDDPENLTGGTHRYLEFKIERWILRHVPQQMEWEFLDASTFNPPAKQG